MASRGIFRLSSRRWNSYITTPIFYANAAPHLGHLYTTVLADAAHRWEVLKDPTAKHVFSTGTDEHGIKILRSAEAQKKDPLNFCDEVSLKFRELFDAFDIRYTHYIRTTDPSHKRAVQHMWEILNSKGFIYKDVYSGWYSVVDECFYQDKDVEDGEVGGKKVVKGTKTVVEWVEEENYMFKLSAFRERIRHWLSSEDIVQPRHYLPVILRYLDLDEDLSISRCRKRLPWGIPVPNDDSQTIYVWLDALVNYLSICGYPDDQATMASSWPPSCHILGKDIMKFHAVYWPAFLLAAELPLPKRLFVHGHWLVDNTKMSKSLGNVVEPFEASKTFSAEGLRYFLLKQGVPQDDSNFTPKKALQVINSDLVNNVGNLLSRGTVAKLNPNQKYPFLDQVELDSGIREHAEPLITSLNEISESTRSEYDKLRFYKAIEGIMAVVKQGNAFFQVLEPWKLSQGPKLSSVLHICYETVRVSSILLQPVVPHFADHALNRLGISPEKRSLSSAKFGGDKSEFTGSPLGSDAGPFLQRLKENGTK